MFSGTRNAVFRKRSPEWSFFLKRRLIVFVRKVRDAIVFHSLYPFRVEGQKRGIRYMCTRIFSKTEKKIPVFKTIKIHVNMAEA